MRKHFDFKRVSNGFIIEERTFDDVYYRRGADCVVQGDARNNLAQYFANRCLQLMSTPKAAVIKLNGSFSIETRDGDRRNPNVAERHFKFEGISNGFFIYELDSEFSRVAEYAVEGHEANLSTFISRKFREAVPKGNTGGDGALRFAIDNLESRGESQSGAVLGIQPDEDEVIDLPF
jgi:hypothetical protein